MAFPGITEDQYRAAFEQLCEDSKPEAITANQLQRVAGGRYGRAADALERLMNGWRKAQQAQQLIPVQPSWYRDFVSQSLEQHREHLESQWSAIGPHIQERILEATTKLETERDGLKLKYEEDRAQIELLENELEGLEQKCSELQVSKHDLELLKQEYNQLQDKFQDKVKLSIDLDNDRKKACSERDALTGRIHILQEELANSRHHLKKAEVSRESFIKLEQRNEALMQKIQSVEDSERQTVLDNMSLKTRAQEQEKRIAELSNASNQHIQENRTLIRQMALMEQELAVTRQREQELVQQLEETQEQQKEKPQEDPKEKDGGTGNALQ